MKVKLNKVDALIYDKWAQRGKFLLLSPHYDYASMFRVILRMRQICCHTALIPRLADDFDTTNNDIVERFQEVLRSSGDADDCPVCYKSLNLRPVCISSCGHM